jgi:hypothetical protein
MSAVVSTRESCGSATRRPGASAHTLTRRPGRRRAITAPSFTRSPWRSRAHHGALTCSRAAAGLIVDIITRRLGRHRGGAGHAHHGQVAARDHESDRVGRAGEVPDEDTNQRPSEAISPHQWPSSAYFIVSLADSVTAPSTDKMTSPTSRLVAPAGRGMRGFSYFCAGTQSVAISGNQWQSVAISGNRWQSVAIQIWDHLHRAHAPR